MRTLFVRDQGMLATAEVDRRWSMHVAPALQRWRDGPVFLVKDVAHPMRRHHGQGAKLSIGYACALAQQINCMDARNRKQR